MSSESSSMNNGTDEDNNGLPWSRAELSRLKFAHFTNPVIDEYMVNIGYYLYEVHALLDKPQDPAALLKYSSMSYIEMWEDGAKHMARLMYFTNRFCRRIPGFGHYYRNPEQLRVLKACAYDLVIIRMSHLIDLEKDVILYGQLVLPMSQFAQNNDSHPDDLELAVGTLDAAKTIAGFKLTDMETALYMALVLSWPEREGLGDLKLLPELHDVVIEMLEIALKKDHAPKAKEIQDKLTNLIPRLRDLAKMYTKSLRRFEETHPEYRFPVTNCFPEMFCDPDVYNPLINKEN